MSEIRLRRPRVLYLDSDPAQTAAFEYALLDYAEVFPANDVGEAWRLLVENLVTVIVADLDLAFGPDGSDGFLRRAQSIKPEAINIVVATTLHDPALLVRVLNSGLVWRIYDKTGPEYLGHGRLPEIVREASREQARREVASAIPEPALGVFRRIVQVLETGKGQSGVWQREQLCRLLAPDLDLWDRERELLPVAAVLHGLNPLTNADANAEMLMDVGGLEIVGSILSDLQARFDGEGRNPHEGNAIHILARVLAVVVQFDFVMRDPFGETNKIDAALARVEAQSGGAYDPEVVKAFAHIVRKHRGKVEEMYRLAN